MVLDRSYLAEMSYQPPDRDLELADEDLRLVSKLTSWRFAASVLEVGGYAYVSNLSNDDWEIGLTAVAGALRVPLAVRKIRDDGIDIVANDAWHSHADAGFAAVLDLDALRAADHQQPAAWDIEIMVRSGPVRRSGTFLTNDIRGPAALAPAAPDDGAGRWIVRFDKAGGLRLRYRPRGSEVIAAEVAVDGEQVVIAFDHEHDVTGLQATAEAPRRIALATRMPDQPGEPHRFRIELPAPGELPKRRSSWQLRTTDPTPRPLALPHAPAPEGEHRPLTVHAGPNGIVDLRQQSWATVIDAVELTTGTLTLTGRTSAPVGPPMQAELVSERAVLRDAQVTRQGAEHVRIEFDLAAGGPLDKRAAYDLRLVTDIHGVAVRRWAQPGAGLLQTLPVEHETEVNALSCSRSRDGALRVRFRQPYAPDERGRRAQHLLQQVFAGPAALRDSVLFESFTGKSVTDSPRALCEELVRQGSDRELFWTVDDLLRPVPEGTTPLLLYSRRWMEILHTSRYLVNNANFPHYFRKQPDQVYIQTWHGTPLKRIGNDVPGTSLSLPYRALMTREPTYWDLLLAQNDFAASVLPRAFGYTGEVLNLGYPRNDLLLECPPELRQRVRERLGLASNTLAVLYAPTWRDTAAITRGYAFVRYLEPKAVRAAFGPRAAILLRGHANTINDHARVTDGVVDVTSYPEIDELFLAADVLVTDYSSVMFDFCVTGKPMIFLTPDLAQYRDKTRGFYFDFTAQVPGPICMTTAEVVAELADLAGLETRYRDAYETFRRTYAPQDDGKASARVVERIWGAR